MHRNRTRISTIIIYNEPQDPSRPLSRNYRAPTKQVVLVVEARDPYCGHVRPVPTRALSFAFGAGFQSAVNLHPRCGTPVLFGLLPS